ncbi:MULTISPECIES: PEP-CTERM sorting domain-containing protein [unclassified Nostoc]|uniref:PEP-CTERM sorting domain-containing protein n=1 Tax=unclassified Nostoc TaxID=2593658 RepID=UPI0025AADEDD|nr:MULTISPECIES: PEP-CTERM sorting domain-containing protein [unclassified Nostoc]MDM9585627.1 PEP-CTERM sorting domain-containing protein [Nostoc sp. GT001]MDZ7948272.1 PEP-CTERM sorting domain-containing protein [Nostoc sp. EfeVER01]MDZ7992914.1 PEP-CTERM sorting domain-containing protein [Nostoc sp. EspVER01]
MIKNNKKKAIAQAISTTVALGWMIMEVESVQAATLTAALDSITIGGNLTISTDKLYIKGGSKNSGAAGTLTITTNALTVRPGAIISKPVPQPSAIAAGSNHSGLGGNITLTIPDLIILKPVRKPSAIADDSNNNSGAGGNITLTTSNLILRRVPETSAIAAGNINSGSAGNITINSGTLILNPGAILSKPVPEPSAIAGIILAGSLTWLVKRKQVVFRKAKV